MSPTVAEFIAIDVPAALAGTLAALSCGLLGNLLVLRRMSLMGDAISHAVLPGLVIAFLVSGDRASLPMFLGAAAAGVVTVVLVDLVRRYGRLESGAAMGVVFSILFALGVLLLEQTAARAVDLDADCVLNGVLEQVFWFPPETWSAFLTLETARELPRQVWTLLGTTAVVILVMTVFRKELKLCAFDPGLATALGFRAGLVNHAYLVVVAAAVVASFEAVGSILVVAMLICPAATARLLTDRYGVQILLSGVFAVVSGIAGYALAATAPSWLDLTNALSAAGMMTVVSGVLLLVAAVASPSHGVVAKAWRGLAMSVAVAEEDLLGLLYRAAEDGADRVPHAILHQAPGGRRVVALAIRRLRRRGWAVVDGDGLRLAEEGRIRARTLVRTHRLWEDYLVRKLGLRADHVHRTAMNLEHVTSEEMQSKLAEASEDVTVDPHDRPIPGVDE